MSTVSALACQRPSSPKITYLCAADAAQDKGGQAAIAEQLAAQVVQLPSACA